jgi:hypothetical protein
LVKEHHWIIWKDLVIEKKYVMIYRNLLKYEILVKIRTENWVGICLIICALGQ